MASRVWGLSKLKANYRPAPEPGVRCDHCAYMFPPLGLGGWARRHASVSVLRVSFWPHGGRKRFEPDRLRRGP